MNWGEKKQNKTANLNPQTRILYNLGNWRSLSLILIAGAAAGVCLAYASSHKSAKMVLENNPDKAISQAHPAGAPAAADRTQPHESGLYSVPAMTPAPYSRPLVVAEGQAPVAYQVAVVGTDGPRLKMIVAR